MIFDTHVHSTFSPDSNCKMSDYSVVVDNGRVNEIGFAEHVDFMPECGAYGYFNYAEYITEIQRLNNLGYKFHAGAEIDYSQSVETEIIQHLSKHSYEYTIASVHMLNGFSVSDGRNTELLRDDIVLREIAQKYYDEVSASLKVKKFDVIAHIDIYARYLDVSFFTNPDIKRYIEELQNALAYECYKYNKIIEVNTSGLFAPYKNTLPGVKFLEAYYNLGGRRISLASDAHSIENVARGFEQVSLMLKGIGFKHYLLPWKPEEPVYFGG